MSKWLVAILVLVFSTSICSAQSIILKNFVVKETLLKNGKLAIVAADEQEQPIEQLNGTFLFSINGFKQELKFHDGVATTPQAIEKSTFVYLKHQNDSLSKAKLYYVLKREDGLNPIKVSWLVFVLIPLVLVMIASAFRKFIIFAIVIILGMFYFNSSNGLSLPNYFDTIIEGLKSFLL